MDTRYVYHVCTGEAGPAGAAATARLGVMSTILITGASSGLGAEMARQFAAGGHDLALCARRTDRLEELRTEILAAHPDRTVAVRALDVTDDDAVFETVRAFRDELGGLDRVVVNAGLGKGAALGTGRYAANRETAMVNFVAAIAQAEAAMEVFREQGSGHLVLVSSMSALRGMPKSMTVYAATKAALSSLGEGLQSELLGKPIKVTVLHCGYIASEMNEQVQQQVRFMVSTEDGVRAMVDAIEKEKAQAYVPPLPWAALAPVMRHAPLPVLKRML
jgi:short-subunit dehydrogenase